MPRRTLETGPVIAAVGAVLLLVSLWLEWFEPVEGRRLSGWTSFEVLDLVLAALAIAALLAGAHQLGYATPVSESRLALIGLAAFVIVGSQLLNHPPVGIGRAPELGAWLALGASALITAGAVVGRARISVEVVVDRARGQGADPGSVESSARAEAAAEEPKVERELYPNERGNAPLGANDPEPFRTGPEDETRRIG